MERPARGPHKESSGGSRIPKETDYRGARGIAPLAETVRYFSPLGCYFASNSKGADRTLSHSRREVRRAQQPRRSSQRARADRKRPNSLVQMCPCTYHMAALNSQSHNGVIWSRTVRISNDFFNTFNIKTLLCMRQNLPVLNSRSHYGIPHGIWSVIWHVICHIALHMACDMSYEHAFFDFE